MFNIIMSEQEIDSSPPLAKKRKRVKPLQPLSLPVLQQDYHNNINRRKHGSKSQQFVESAFDSNFLSSVPGVIKKIELINFMCHSHFEISFNPRINFISGVNGSGKSAIQTGIAIGLGGVASKTNRSTKLEGLIKHGCNSGSVIITMSNTGKNAFKPSEYGNEIRVVRNINRSSSTYRIYNEYGKLVSSKKQDLDSILLKLKIQPNNPIAILNQDMARNFLSTNKAENKYAMFRKATLLDEAESLLCSIHNEIEDQKEQIYLKEKVRRKVEGEIEVMTKKIELHTKLKEAKAKKFRLDTELVWGEVNMDMEELDRLKRIRGEQNLIKERYNTDILELNNNISEKEAKIKEMNNSLEMLKNESKTNEENVQRTKSEFRQKKQSYEDKCEEYQRISSKIRSKKADKDNIQSSLDDIEREEAEQKMKKTEALKEIEKLKEYISENDGKVKILDQEIVRHKNTSAHFYEMRKEKERALYRLNEEIEINKRQINSFKKSDDLSMYAQWMPALVNRITEAVQRRLFSKPPKGPLGRYIKVKDEKWTSAIENHLGTGFLCSFFVNSGEDRKLLYKIMDEICQGQKPTVHCSQFQEQHRDFISSHEAACRGYLNMLRTLDISDTVVANFLMDSRQIYEILLVDDNSVCRELAKDDRNYPKNCSAIINLNADQYLSGYKFYANMKPTRSRLLQKNAAQQIRYLTEEINEKMNTIKDAKVEIMDLHNQAKNSAGKVNEMMNELKKYRELIARNKRQISELQNIIEMEMPSLQAKIDELDSISEEIKALEAKKNSVAEEQKTYFAEMSRVKELVNSMNCGDSIVQQTQLSTEIETIRSTMKTLVSKKQVTLKKQEEQDTKIEKLDRRIEELGLKIDAQTQSAIDLVDEPQSSAERRTLHEIKEELNQVISFIAEAERKIGNEAINFEKEYWQKQKSFGEFHKMFTELKKMHAEYIIRAKDRKANIEQLRDLCSNVILTQFETVLTSRNYKGKLQFNHNSGKLDILMAPADSGENFMNTESLSGGEKSFSTVAFLMALWSNMDLPFYSMDEYDVFMDAINRRTITGLLTSFACDKNTRQFIFLTPLDVSLIQTGPNVAVHRIKK